MLDRNLILCGPPIGLVLGVAVWLSTGHDGPQQQALDAAAGKLQAMRPANVHNAATTGAAPSLTATLFAQPEPGAIPAEVSVALQGLTRNARRQAALLAIGGRTADWLAVGETRDGVTLDSVRASGVTISTATGSRDLSFGPASAAPAAPSGGFDPGPPPGMRGPPPPASAPGAP